MTIKTKVFGEMAFDTGWEAQTAVIFFDREFKITVRADAYFEKDGITDAQTKAFRDFADNKDAKLKAADEALNRLCAVSGGKAASRFTPHTLLFQRDGSYALLFDDKEDLDNGYAVCLAPEVKTLTLDEYL